MRGALLAVTGVAAATALGMTAVRIATAADQPPPVAGQLARGTVDDRVHLRSSGNDPTDVLVQEITIRPGGSTGWHSHPGQAIVVVESGTFTLRSAHGGRCLTEVYGPGDAFVDPGRGFVHSGTNRSADEPLVVTVTYLLPRMTGSPRSSAEAPEPCAG